MTQDLQVCGIYIILNLENNKIYVGSSIDIERRRKEHFRNLKFKNHKNRHLQSSYDLGNKFEFWIVEVCSQEQLTIRETWWMDLYSSYISKYGYNLWKNAPRPAMSEETRALIGKANLKYKGNLSKLSKRAILCSPTGEKVELNGIREFARLNNLSSSHLAAMIRGKFRQCKGWTLFTPQI